MKNWTIRRYKLGDENGIIHLFQDVFKSSMGKTESINHWEWEYKNNPNDRLEILLAIDNNKIVGHYSVIPVKMKIGNEEYIASLSLDTMTNKEYRGQGIFPILASKLYDDLGKTGIPITYGFPNANSYSGFIKKLDWFEISNIPIYVFPLNFIPLFNRYLKSKFLSTFIGNITNILYYLFLKKKKMPNNLKIEEISEFDKKFDDLWILVKNEIILGRVRDSKYLNWRYFEKPGENYVVFVIKKKTELKGFVVLKTEVINNLKIGFIMDILTDSSDMAYQNLLINYTFFYFRYNNVDLISCLMFPHWRYFKSLNRKIFLKQDKKSSTQNILCARKNNNNIDIQLVKDSINWYLTWGDTDAL